MASRLPRIEPSAQTGAAAELYARYTTGERARPDAAFTLVTTDGQLTGPPATWILSPALGLRLEQLGYGVRFELTIPDRWREIVILTVAEREDSPFERYAHHPAARAAGLSDSEILLLDAGTFTGADASERVLAATTRALLDDRDLSEAEWRDAEHALGAGAVLEIVTLVGWYRLVAMQLRVYRVEPPAS